MGKKSGPAIPDYAAAAQQQAQSSKNVTEQQSWGNRPDQITPFGSQRWANQMQWDPSTQQYLNRWTQTTQVAPELQGALQNQFNITNARSQLGSDLTKRLQGEMGQPMDWSNLPKVDSLNYGDLPAYRQKMEDNLYQRATSRLDPQWQAREDQQRARLYNMGATEGDAAYNQAMQELGRDRNDAYQQAQYGATAGGGVEQANQIAMGGQIQGQQTQARQQAIAEEMQRRGFSLNEINAALSGAQIGLPSMPSFTNNQASQGVQALQAAGLTGQGNLDSYNAQQQGTQGMISGIGSLALGAMM